jgi:dTDP-4-amino-4,6-dideoxygalactose transaminase
MDLVELSVLCSERTLAVVPTHLGGRVVDATAARQAASACGAVTIEDAAQALGATVEGSSVGTQSDMVFFSLAIGKGLTTFEGGALHVRDAALRAACHDVAARIAPFSLKWELLRSLQLFGSAVAYRPGGLGLAYGRPLKQALRRGDWIEAAGDDFSPDIPLHSLGRWRQAVGLRALHRLADFLHEGRLRAARRGERLRRIAGVQVLGDSERAGAADGTWPVLMLLLPDQPRRDLVLGKLWGAGCGVSLPFVHALPDYAAYAHAVPRVAADAVPHARALARRLITISNSPWLSDERFEAVCEEIERVVREKTAVR